MTEERPAEVVIWTPDRRLRVFVSSTLGELADERRAVARAVSALRLTPVMFELGARPHPPQDLYRAYLAQSDVFIGLYWQRYGWIGAGMEISGLEEELQLARAAGLPRLLYIKAPAPEREPGLVELLARVKQEALDSYRYFRSPGEPGRLVRDDLATLLSERFAATGPTAAGSVPLTGGVPSVRRGPRPLPVATTSLVGLEQAIDEVAGLVGRPDTRLVTLTGPGGVGKTRLAVAVGERLRDRFRSGVAFIPLVGVTQLEPVLSGIGRAVGADLAGVGAPLEALVEYFGDDRWLLVLDNLEQAVEVARDLDELLTRCASLEILATSRTVLGLRAEWEYPVAPLPLPATPTGLPVDQLATVPAVALFVDRAQAVRYDFALTEGNAAAVVGICRRLEGLPLAIELAAARIRLLDPDALMRRLATSLDALGTGTVDLPERQRTLRATVEWSVGLLDDAERSLLETVAVFVDGWTVDAAAQVAGLEEDRALELSEALANHSLVYLHLTDQAPRLQMLETVRAFVAERLAARPDLAEIERRHTDYYRALADRADRPLRGVGYGEWAERLQTDAGNLAATVEWYLAHDRGPLPHLFRVLWPFWEQREHMGEVRAWVEPLLGTADSLDSEAQAELLWTALVTANEVGDDAGALAARQRLESLLPDVQDPYLRAVSQLAMAWTSPIVGDLNGALQGLLASLEQLRGQDESYWTAVAVASTVSLEVAAGRYDDALRRMTEARDLAERLDDAWLAAWSRVLLGTLAVIQSRRDARSLVEEGLDLSLATHSTPLVSLCLISFARLASAEGDAERAALLLGAAEGLRRRVGLRAWPMLRRGEAELLAEARQALGADKFERALAAGSRLNQREAVAAARDGAGAGASGP